MKKIIYLFIALVMGVSTLKAQQNKGVVKINPLSLAIGVFNAAYEIPLSEKSSFQVGANYFNYKNLDISGFGLSAEYRFYFSNNNEAPEGIFVAPQLRVSSFSYTGYQDTEKLISLGGGFKGGYQWIWDSGVGLDLFAGYGYQAAKFESYDYTGGFPIFGIAVGYAF